MNAERQILREALDDSSCPAFEDLWSALDGALEGERGRGILLHLKGCVRCQAEAGLAEDFRAGAVLPSEKEDVDWIENKLRASLGEGRDRAFGLEPRGSRLLRFLKPLSGIGSGWKPLAAIAAMALLAVVAIQWPDSTPILPESASPSGVVRSKTLQLTHPVGLQAQPPQQWNWPAVEGAELYQVRFLEVDGHQLLMLQTEQTILATPPEIADLLRPGKRILWQVSALDGEGARLAASPPQPVWLDVSGDRPR